MRGSIRSLLFVPGDDRRRLEKALAAGADAVVADLEDSVAQDAKAAAREVVVSARAARGLGMRGKICVHPCQVATVNQVFGAEFAVERARATIAAYESMGRGAVAYGGEMVDLAVVERARRVLREAQAAR